MMNFGIFSSVTVEIAYVVGARLEQFMNLTFKDILSRSAQFYPDKVAFSITGDGDITYKDLYARSIKLALKLKEYKDKNIGILLPNSVDWAVCLFAVALAGKCAVLLNIRLTPEELAYQIDQSDTGILLTCKLYKKNPDDLVDTIEQECKNCKAIVWFGDEPLPNGCTDVRQWQGSAAIDNGSLPAISPQDLAVIIYTSGTTSLPKGVMLSHYAVVLNALLVGQAFGMTVDDKVFSAGPFAHSGGLTMHVIMSVLYSATAYSVPNFNPELVVDTVYKEQCTIYNGIETLFLRLLDAPNFKKDKLKSIRTGWATGSPSILHRIADEVGMAGIIGVYGISEAAPNVLISHHTEPAAKRLDTIGKPHPLMQARVVIPGTDTDVADGKIGELILSGYSLMQGYYKMPEQTAKTLKNGWLYTGDLVRRRPDGYFEFAGRNKDIIRFGGENISALEVEDVMHSIDGVAIATLLPVPSDMYGEIAIAVVKPVTGLQLSEKKIMGILKERLASYKVPKQIVLMTELPLTDSGKVQKKVLVKRLLEQHLIDEQVDVNGN